MFLDIRVGECKCWKEKRLADLRKYTEQFIEVFPKCPQNSVKESLKRNGVEWIQNALFATSYILRHWPAPNLAQAWWGSGRWFGSFTPGVGTHLSLCATAAQCITHHTGTVLGHDLFSVPDTHLMTVRLTDWWSGQWHHRLSRKSSTVILNQGLHGVLGKLLLSYVILYVLNWSCELVFLLYGKMKLLS